jgi:hypothetical protein
MVDVFLYKYEYGTVKLVKSFYEGGRGRRSILEWMNQTRVYCTIYGNVIMKFRIQLIYTNKNI